MMLPDHFLPLACICPLVPEFCPGTIPHPVDLEQVATQHLFELSQLNSQHANP